MTWLNAFWQEKEAQLAPCAAIAAFHVLNMFPGMHGSALVPCPSSNFCFVMCLLLLRASPKNSGFGRSGGQEAAGDHRQRCTQAEASDTALRTGHTEGQAGAQEEGET